MADRAFWEKLFSRPVLVAALLALAMALTYGGALRNDFVNWDDYQYVVHNEVVKGFTAAHVGQAFTRTFIGNYAPVQMLSYMLDYTVWGLSPFGFILTNLLIHFLNGLLLYYLTRRIVGSDLAAALAAYLFVLHPLQVESVVWISQRKNVLAMLFFLLSFAGYLQYAAAEKRSAALFYSLSVIAYTLAVLTKVAAIVLPLVLVVYASCYRRDIDRKRTGVEVLPYAIVTSGIVWITIVAQKQGQSGVFAQQYAGTALKTFFTMLAVFPQYLINIVWPQYLSIIYSPPIREQVDSAVFAGVVLLLLLLLAGTLLYRKRSGLFFWYALFFIAFLPVSQLVPMQTIIQDRYCYFPLIGGCGFVGAWVAGCFRQPVRTPVLRVAIGLVLVPLVVLPVVARQRTAVWRDTITLFTATYRSGIGDRYSDYANFVALSLADAYVTEGEKFDQRNDSRRALVNFLMALQYEPLHHEVLLYVTMLLLDRGNYDGAYPYLEQVTHNYPRSAVGQYLLGQFFRGKNNTVQARQAYQRALQLDPTNVLAKEALAAISGPVADR
jgi:tetratricopeptide (TPR) repeat protein